MFDAFGNSISERKQMRNTVFLSDYSKVEEYESGLNDEERNFFVVQSVRVVNLPFYAL